jgi:hypothetical protein
VITNDWQYRVTKAAVKRFEQALEAGREQDTQLDPRLAETMKEGIESEINALREQLAEYEAFRSGQVTGFSVEFEHLADALIRARVAAGLTQKQLADRLGIQEQQVQRYEAKEYEPASFARLKEIIWALGVTVQVHVSIAGSSISADEKQSNAAYATTTITSD